LKPRRHPNVLTTQAGNDVVLNDPRTRMVHLLNVTAAAVWNLCDGRHTPDEIAQSIKMQFLIPAAQDVDADVRDLLARLNQSGLLEGVDG